MTTSQYADLIPVDLTADDVFRNLPREQTIGWHAAPNQIVAFGEKILMYRDPANDNKKPEEKETQPDPAETALRKLEEHLHRLSPPLEKQVATHSIKKQQPNRTAQKTFHAPQPETKSISTEPLKNIMHFYQEQSPEYQERLAAEKVEKMVPRKAHAGKKDPGLLRLVHTGIDLIIDETPLPKNSPTLKTALHIAQLLLAA